MKKNLMAVLLLVCLLLTMAACGGTQGTETAQTDVITTDTGVTYYADIEIADYGTVTVQLDQSAAPVTVANFVSLAQSIQSVSG